MSSREPRHFSEANRLLSGRDVPVCRVARKAQKLVDAVRWKSLVSVCGPGQVADCSVNIACSTVECCSFCSLNCHHRSVKRDQNACISILHTFVSTPDRKEQRYASKCLIKVLGRHHYKNGKNNF